MQPHTIASYDAELESLDGLVGDMAHRAEASLVDASPVTSSWPSG